MSDKIKAKPGWLTPGTQPKPAKPAPEQPKPAQVKHPKKAAGGVATVGLLLLLGVLNCVAQDGWMQLGGAVSTVYTDRLQTTIAGSGTTNQIFYTNNATAFGNTNAIHIRTNATTGRWEWHTDWTTRVATNTANRPTGTWQTAVASPELYGYTRYTPRSVGAISTSPGNLPAIPTAVKVDSNRVIVDPVGFWDANAGNIPHVSTNVFYVSQWPGVTAVPGASTNGGIGPDSGPALQALFDQVTNYPAGIEIVRDNQFITSQTLKIRSNTKLTALNATCGFVLSNAVSQPLLVNYNLNGNFLTDSNITVQCGGSFGNRWSQNRYLTNGPYFDGIFSPIIGTDEVAYTAGALDGSTEGVAEGTTHWRPWLYCVRFSGVQNLRVENEAFNESRTFALTIGNITTGKIRNNYFYWSSPQDGSQDSVHTFTPLVDVQITDNISNGDDDMIAFNTDELAYVTNINTRVWRGTNGGGRNVLVADNYRINSAGGFVRIISYNSTLGKNGFTNLTIRGLRGAIPSSGWIAGAVNSIYTSAKTYIDGLVIKDVKLTNNVAVGIDLINVNGTWADISGVVGYGVPSFYHTFNQWGSDRLTQGFIALDTGWDSVSVHDSVFNSLTSTTNVALITVRYPYSRKIGSLRVFNNEISGKNVRALVANHGDIGTITFNGNTTTNAVPIPEVYTAKTVPGGGTIAVRRVVGGTNYAEDTTLWLRRCRLLGQEPTPSQMRAVDWGLQFFQNTGDLINMPEIGFLAGATNIAAILPKVRTFWTNEWSTNAFQVNSGFTSSDLSRYGLTANGSSYLDTQLAMTVNGLGAVWKTNFSYGIYIHTYPAATSGSKLWMGASYASSSDSTRFGLTAWNTSDPNSPTVWLGNRYDPKWWALTNAGMQAVSVSNSLTDFRVYFGGTNFGSSTWNNDGFQTGSFHVMRGQTQAAPSGGIVSFWYLGNGSVNQSNVAYGAKIMTEMAGCYSPMSIYATGWTNYFAGTASVLVKGGANVGVTNQLGQTVGDLAAATNVTFTLKPGWVIGGSGMSGTATEISN